MITLPRAGTPWEGKGAQRLGPFCAPLLYGRFQFVEFVSHCMAGEISLQGRRDRRLKVDRLTRSLADFAPSQSAPRPPMGVPVVIDEPRIRFYAGYPLMLDDGSCIGTLCLLDTRPRTVEGSDLERLHDLADMVLREISGLAAQ